MKPIDLIGAASYMLIFLAPNFSITLLNGMIFAAYIIINFERVNE